MKSYISSTDIWHFGPISHSRLYDLFALSLHNMIHNIDTSGNTCGQQCMQWEKVPQGTSDRFSLYVVYEVSIQDIIGQTSVAGLVSITAHHIFVRRSKRLLGSAKRLQVTVLSLQYILGMFTLRVHQGVQNNIHDSSYKSVFCWQWTKGSIPLRDQKDSSKVWFNAPVYQILQELATQTATIQGLDQTNLQ